MFLKSPPPHTHYVCLFVYNLNRRLLRTGRHYGGLTPPATFSVSSMWDQRTHLRKVKVLVAQSCPTLCHPMDCSVHGILQVRILEWVAIPFSRESSWPRDQTQVSHIMGRSFTIWATGEALNIRIGLPYGSVVKNPSTCQCRRHWFNPWSRKLPHASEPLSPCIVTTEPVL